MPKGLRIGFIVRSYTQSEPGSNGNENQLHTPQISRTAAPTSKLVKCHTKNTREVEIHSEPGSNGNEGQLTLLRSPKLQPPHQI